jgi:hypothetical protein
VQLQSSLFCAKTIHFNIPQRKKTIAAWYTWFEYRTQQKIWRYNIGIRYGSVSKPCTPGEHQNSW